MRLIGRREEDTMIEALYNQYFHDVFLYLKAISHSDDIAEELTQETFFKAMKMTDSFRGECDIRVWLCQIAKNCYFSFCRKHKHENDAELTEDIPDEPAPAGSEILRLQPSPLRYLPQSRSVSAKPLRRRPGSPPDLHP